MHVCAHVYACMCMCVCACMYVGMHGCLCVCMHVCACTRMCVMAAGDDHTPARLQPVRGAAGFSYRPSLESARRGVEEG